MLFNHLAEKKGLAYTAFSKGLRLSKRNKGPVSIHTETYFKNKGIEVIPTSRMPIPVTKQDFDFYNRIIALDEKEHRDLMKQFFPDKETEIEYWNFADDYIEEPATVLPRLEEKVYSLIEQLKK